MATHPTLGFAIFVLAFVGLAWVVLTLPPAREPKGW